MTKYDSQGKEGLLPASAAPEVHLKVYQRCVKRHLRVLKAKITSLVTELNDKLSMESSSSSGLQDELVTNNIPEVSSCSDLLDEIQRTIAKRDAIYAANQKIDKGDGNDNRDANPHPAVGM